MFNVKKKPKVFSEVDIPSYILTSAMCEGAGSQCVRFYRL